MSHAHSTSSSEEGVQVIRRPDDEPTPAAQQTSVTPSGEHQTQPLPAGRPAVGAAPAVRTGARVQGGPVWAGFAVALATWVLLQLVVFALDLGSLSSSIVGGADSAGLWWSGVAAVIALFIGGLVAGASSEWDGLSDGLLQGIVVWSILVVALVVLSAIGVGVGFGVVGDLLVTTRGIGNGQIVSATVTSTAQDAAAGAVLALGVSIVASALGGAAGAKLWRPESRLGTRQDTWQEHAVR
jgi:hypothetical protein